VGGIDDFTTIEALRTKPTLTAMATNQPHMSYQQVPPGQYMQAIPMYQQPQFIQQPARIIPYNKGWHVTKIVLESLSIIFSAIGIGIACSIINNRASDFAFIVIVCVAPPVSP
jgi:hypothetical protein